jgi:hypothetical protein
MNIDLTYKDTPNEREIDLEKEPVEEDKEKSI